MSHMYPEGASVGFEDQSHIGDSNTHDSSERCRNNSNRHAPDGWRLDSDHHAFMVSTCEHCGVKLRATAIDNQLLKETGEIHVTNWTVQNV